MGVVTSIVMSIVCVATILLAVTAFVGTHFHVGPAAHWAVLQTAASRR